MKTKTYLAATLVAGALCAAFPAVAHVTLDRAQAAVGASYKAVLRVPHGCSGAATKVLRVRIPDGVIGVKPMPKAGWTLAVKREAYGHTYEMQHAKVSEGVREISWTGPGLPDDQYDEFTFVGTIASDLKPDTVLYFPTVQECDGATERWIEIPGDARRGWRPLGLGHVPSLHPWTAGPASCPSLDRSGRVGACLPRLGPSGQWLGPQAGAGSAAAAVQRSSLGDGDPAGGCLGSPSFRPRCRGTGRHGPHHAPAGPAGRDPVAQLPDRLRGRTSGRWRRHIFDWRARHGARCRG